ncbi:hypothetical protein ENBRE01_0195 [Enteropsectra breve]|nr:hypothetical protein ENBRE01_0195 [Enteropsectra breve]
MKSTKQRELSNRLFREYFKGPKINKGKIDKELRILGTAEYAELLFFYIKDECAINYETLRKAIAITKQYIEENKSSKGQDSNIFQCESGPMCADDLYVQIKAFLTSPIQTENDDCLHHTVCGTKNDPEVRDQQSLHFCLYEQTNYQLYKLLFKFVHKHQDAVIPVVHEMLLHFHENALKILLNPPNNRNFSVMLLSCYLLSSHTQSADSVVLRYSRSTSTNVRIIFATAALNFILLAKYRSKAQQLEPENDKSTNEYGNNKDSFSQFIQNELINILHDVYKRNCFYNSAAHELALSAIKALVTYAPFPYDKSIVSLLTKLYGYRAHPKILLLLSQINRPANDKLTSFLVKQFYRLSIVETDAVKTLENMLSNQDFSISNYKFLLSTEGLCSILSKNIGPDVNIDLFLSLVYKLYAFNGGKFKIEEDTFIEMCVKRKLSEEATALFYLKLLSVGKIKHNDKMTSIILSSKNETLIYKLVPLIDENVKIKMARTALKHMDYRNIAVFCRHLDAKILEETLESRIENISAAIEYKQSKEEDNNSSDDLSLNTSKNNTNTQYMPEIQQIYTIFKKIFRKIYTNRTIFCISANLLKNGQVCDELLTYLNLYINKIKNVGKEVLLEILMTLVYKTDYGRSGSLKSSTATLSLILIKQLILSINKKIGIENTLCYLKLDFRDRRRELMNDLFAELCNGNEALVVSVLITDYKLAALELKDDKQSRKIVNILKIIAKITSLANAQMLWPLLQDSVTSKCIDSRKHGFAAISNVVNMVDDTDLLMHIFNFIWFFSLDEKCKDEVNACIANIINKLTLIYSTVGNVRNKENNIADVSEYFIKYFAEGLIHPSRRTRRKYLNHLKILKNGR